MKFIFTILTFFLFTGAYGKSDTYSHLVAINKCWTSQNDYPALPGNENISDDKEWIRLHLSLVEETLRNRSTAHLNADQKANRLLALEYLRDYRQQGHFPVNDKYTARTPIFIDDHDNFCAVGYLIKATGHEAISRMISAETNLAYVREMQYPQLNEWAIEYGFTVDELAWIQPSYGPIAHRGTASVGKGTNGVVTELFVDNSGDRLYVGGSFSRVDSTIDAQNIAYVTENSGNYQWHTLGGGLNGPVYAICEYQGKIFAGGAFTEAGGVPVTGVAYWDGISWHDAGCLYGTVTDLIVHNDGLFAVGDFDVCAALSEVNAAKWNGSNMWMQMPLLEGHVNTIESYGGSLILGGQFVWNYDTVNIIKWSDDLGYEPYANTIKNEVKDIGLFKNTLYAVCKRTSATDSMLVQKLVADTWTGHPIIYDNSLIPDNREEYNTICVYGDTAMLGGYFSYQGMFFPSFKNCMDIEWMNEAHNGNWFMVDSTINKMVVYKNELFFGGAFKASQDEVGTPGKLLNGIGKMYRYKLTDVNELNAQNPDFKIYPNPIQANGILKITNNMNAGNLQLMSIEGRSIGTFKLSPKQSEIRLPDLASGTYLLLMTDSKGAKAAQKLIID